MLERQVVCCVVAAVVGVTRVRFSQQDVNGCVIRVVHIWPVLAKPTSCDRLDNTMHLDKVPGAVGLHQGQSMQLAGGSAKPQRRRKELEHVGRIIYGLIALQEKLGGDRFRGEKRAQVK